MILSNLPLNSFRFKIEARSALTSQRATIEGAIIRTYRADVSQCTSSIPFKALQNSTLAIIVVPPTPLFTASTREFSVSCLNLDAPITYDLSCDGIHVNTCSVLLQPFLDPLPDFQIQLSGTTPVTLTGDQIIVTNGICTQLAAAFTEEFGCPKLGNNFRDIQFAGKLGGQGFSTSLTVRVQQQATCADTLLYDPNIDPRDLVLDIENTCYNDISETLELQTTTTCTNNIHPYSVVDPINEVRVCNGAFRPTILATCNPDPIVFSGPSVSFSHEDLLTVSTSCDTFTVSPDVVNFGCDNVSPTASFSIITQPGFNPLAVANCLFTISQDYCPSPVISYDFDPDSFSEPLVNNCGNTIDPTISKVEACSVVGGSFTLRVPGCPVTTVNVPTFALGCVCEPTVYTLSNPEILTSSLPSISCQASCPLSFTNTVTGSPSDCVTSVSRRVQAGVQSFDVECPVDYYPTTIPCSFEKEVTLTGASVAVNFRELFPEPLCPYVQISPEVEAFSECGTYDVTFELNGQKSNVLCSVKITVNGVVENNCGSPIIVTPDENGAVNEQLDCVTDTCAKEPVIITTTCPNPVGTINTGTSLITSEVSFDDKFPPSVTCNQIIQFDVDASTCSIIDPETQVLRACSSSDNCETVSTSFVIDDLSGLVTVTATDFIGLTSSTISSASYFVGNIPPCPLGPLLINYDTDFLKLDDLIPQLDPTCLSISISSLNYDPSISICLHPPFDILATYTYQEQVVQQCPLLVNVVNDWPLDLLCVGSFDAYPTNGTYEIDAGDFITQFDSCNVGFVSPTESLPCPQVDGVFPFVYERGSRNFTCDVAITFFNSECPSTPNPTPNPTPGSTPNSTPNPTPGSTPDSTPGPTQTPTTRDPLPTLLLPSVLPTGTGGVVVLPSSQLKPTVLPVATSLFETPSPLPEASKNELQFCQLSQNQRDPQCVIVPQTGRPASGAPIPIVVGGQDGGQVGYVLIPPNAVPPNALISITQPEIEDVDRSRVKSFVFDVKVEGYSSFSLASDARVCLQPQNGQKLKDLCLGFINEKTREWECEDKCLKRQQQNGGRSVFCGTTTHFTSFALLLQTGNKGNGECGDEDQYITNSNNNDIALVASVVGACFLFVIFVVIISYIPIVRRVIVGEKIFMQQQAIRKYQNGANNSI